MARCGAWAEVRHPEEAATGRQVQRGRGRRGLDQKRASVSWVSLPGSVAQGGALPGRPGDGELGRCRQVRAWALGLHLCPGAVLGQGL